MQVLIIIAIQNLNIYKKILRCEHKRHTSHSVAIACYAGGGYPIPFLGGYPTSGLGVPHLRSGGVPHPRSGWGYPIPFLGVPHLRSGGTPSQLWTGGTPSSHGGGYSRYPPSRPGMGNPPVQTWDGVPPNLRWGTHLPDPG